MLTGRKLPGPLFISTEFNSPVRALPPARVANKADQRPGPLFALSHLAAIVRVSADEVV